MYGRLPTVFVLTGVFAASCQFESATLSTPENHDSGVNSVEDAGVDLDAQDTRCFTKIALSDNFETTPTSGQWERWEEGGVAVSETSGTLNIELATTSADYQGGGYISTVPLTLLDKRMFIRVTEMVSTNLPSYAWFFIGEGGENSGYSLGQSEGVLHFKRRLAFGPGGEETLGAVAYNSSNHAIWQLRVTDGIVYAEVGPSLDKLTVLGHDSLDTSDKAAIVENQHVYVIAETYEPIVNPGQLRVSDFNTGDQDCH